MTGGVPRNKENKARCSGVNRQNTAEEGKTGPVATATGETVDMLGKGPGPNLVRWEAPWRGVSDSENVTRLNIYNSNENMNLSPGGDDVRKLICSNKLDAQVNPRRRLRTEESAMPLCPEQIDATPTESVQSNTSGVLRLDDSQCRGSHFKPKVCKSVSVAVNLEAGGIKSAVGAGGAIR